MFNLDHAEGGEIETTKRALTTGKTSWRQYGMLTFQHKYLTLIKPGQVSRLMTATTS